VNTRTIFIALIAVTSLTNLFAGSGVDLSTPERALQSYEDAMRAKDIENYIQCRDFRVEAALKLRDKPPAVLKVEIAPTAQRLEESERARIRKSGFANLTGVTCKIVGRRELNPDTVELTQEFRVADGTTFRKNSLLAHTKGGWKVIDPSAFGAR
jgi:hypothetical protein